MPKLSVLNMNRPMSAEGWFVLDSEQGRAS